MEKSDFAWLLLKIGRHTQGKTLHVETLDFGRSLVVIEQTPARIVRGVIAHWDCDISTADMAIDAYWKDPSKEDHILVLGSGVRGNGGADE